MIRAAILFDERDRKLGKVMISETVFVIRHRDSIFVRTEKGVRLPGGGIGAVFIETEPMVREKLEPA